MEGGGSNDDEPIIGNDNDLINKPSLVTQKIITSATEPNLNVGDQWHREY